MSNFNHSKPYLLQILEDLCPKFGATLHVEPKYGYAGYIKFPSGRRRFFRGTSFDINPQGASTITKDKDYCSYFLSKDGFHVPEGVLVFSPQNRTEMRFKNTEIAKTLPSIQSALDFISCHGFPVFVKPNEGSEGKGVHKVYSFDELFDTLFILFKESPRVLVQRPIGGRNYRVVVLGNEVISAYERTPLRVTGDGINSLNALATQKIRALRANGRGQKVDLSDPRIANYLNAQRLKFDDIVEGGVVVDLLPNANLSAGGEAIDITDDISPSLRNICVSATQALGLSLAGVDVICEDAAKKESEFIILEINSAPGLNNYAALGKAQEFNVRKLYGKLIEFLAKTSSTT